MPIHPSSKGIKILSLWNPCCLWMWVMNVALTFAGIYECRQATPTYPNIRVLFYLLEKKMLCLLAWEGVRAK